MLQVFFSVKILIWPHTCGCGCAMLILPTNCLWIFYISLFIYGDECHVCFCSLRTPCEEHEYSLIMMYWWLLQDYVSPTLPWIWVKEGCYSSMVKTVIFPFLLDCSLLCGIRERSSIRLESRISITHCIQS